MDAPLDITTTDSGIAVSGEIDAHTAPTVAEAIEARDDHRLEIDMSQVEFVDSSGLRVLITAHQRAQEAGRTVVVTRPSEPVRRLFELSGVADFLDVESDDA